MVEHGQAEQSQEKKCSDKNKKEVGEIKTILDAVNENQASKEVLGAILENVTLKIDSVSTLINQNKDFTREQYDGIRNITNELKSDISDVMILLNKTSEFSNHMIEKNRCFKNRFR